MYKTPRGPKPLRIRLDKIGRFIICLDGKIKHLILFDYGLLSKICDKIKYLVSKKVVLQIVLIIILEKSELTQEILTFHDVIILIKSVVSKNKNKCYYNMFLEKGLYKSMNVCII